MAKQKRTSETRRATEQLPVKLEPKEIQAKAQLAARALAEHDAILEALAAHVKETRGEAAELYARAGEELRHIREGAVLQEVRVEEVMDWKANSVTVVRLDTGEIVRQRAMTPEERQGRLFDLDPGEAASGD